MENKIVFLDAGTFYGHPNIHELLQPFGDVQLHEHTRPDEVVARIKKANIVLTNKVVLDEAILSSCPSLKLICVTATGTNNIDLEAAKRKNIVVKNAAGYSTQSVAQTTFAMLLHLKMQLSKYDQFVQTEYYKHPFPNHLSPSFTEIAGKTWGIIGLGTIGKQVARIAEAFGARVIYHSPSGKNIQNSFPHHSLRELLSVADIISLHTPLNDYTRNLINYNDLSYCKPSAILINVARGGIVDEFALAQILDEGKLAGAATDVYAVEPILDDNPLLHLSKREKLLLTPHLAWGSREARERLMQIVCENINVFLTTGK